MYGLNKIILNLIKIVILVRYKIEINNTKVWIICTTSVKAKVRQLADTKKKLDEMKRQKVEMIKKMKDEAKVAREKEKEARKEIIQMKKTMRQTESLGELQI